MGNLVIEPATPADARALGASLRLEALAGVLAVGYRDGATALLHALELSTMAFSGFIGGELATMFGVVKHDGAAVDGRPSGRVWMMAGAVLSKHPRVLLRGSRVILKLFLEEYALLDCWVDERFNTTLKWARWLGFSLDGPHAYGPRQLPFFHCTIERSQACAPQ